MYPITTAAKQKSSVSITEGNIQDNSMRSWWDALVVTLSVQHITNKKQPDESVNSSEQEKHAYHLVSTFVNINEHELTLLKCYSNRNKST